MGAPRGHYGFTLVELTIVVVIVGLLIGGVLKAQDMLTSGRIARIDDDYRKVSTAIDAYRERYGVLPGDDPRASSRFNGSWAAADNGDGDGRIEGEWNSDDRASETRKAWKHLRGAGLLPGLADRASGAYEQPTHAFGGLIGIQQDDYNLDGPVVVFGTVQGNIAAAIESRADDGNPSTGAIQGSNSSRAYNPGRNYNLAFR